MDVEPIGLRRLLKNVTGAFDSQKKSDLFTKFKVLYSNEHRKFL